MKIVSKRLDANDINKLKKEASISLKVFLEMCKEDGVVPQKVYSGNLMCVSLQIYMQKLRRWQWLKEKV